MKLNEGEQRGDLQIWLREGDIICLRTAVVKWWGWNLDYKNFKSERKTGSRNKYTLIFQDTQRVHETKYGNHDRERALK